MPVLGGMTALAGAVRMVNAQKLIEAVRTRATNAALAFHTATTKVATSATVINTLAKRGETVASAQLTVAKRAQMVATVITTGLMGGLAAAMTVLLGPVGLIVLGLAALGVATWAVVKAYQNEQARIEGLGNAAKLTADQLKVLSDVLGVEFRSSAFDVQAQAGVGGAIEADDVQAISQLRESDEFKEEFSGIISALKGSTQAQATVMLEAQAAQLASLAKTEEDLAQIPFILRAQMEEAGIEGIDVELLIPDLTSLDGVAARVQSAIAPISDVGVLSGRALTDQMAIASGSIASTIVMLEQMRNTAVITPQEAAEQFAILSDEINSIDDPGKKFDLMEDVIEDLNMDELAEDIKDTDLLLSLVADRMQGIETPQEVIDLF
jgi:Cu/Ag efflux protein CusF